VVQAVALPDVEVLPANQLRVQEVRDGRAIGAPILMRVQGMVAGQTLVAAGIQPTTAVLYGFGYNPTTRTGSLYTINQRNFSATLVRSTGIRLPNLSSGILRLDFIASANGTTPTMLRISDSRGNYYLVDADQATLVGGNEQSEIPVLDNPYSGAQFIADGTIRNNGLPTADARQDFVSGTTASTENDFGGAGNAGGGQVQMYPNPATYQTRVVLGYTAQATVIAELVDMNGRLAARTSFPAGREVINIDVSRVPAGIYAVRIFEGNVLTHQLRLVRRDQ
jgi:hypothetical protein